MKKFNTSPISGTQELLPGEQASFDNLKTKITETYQTYGFQNIETPCIERTEVLFAKAGGDTEKQIYEVKKTGEKASIKASQALRFDHTVPLARYIVEHENSLTFPLKVAQIGLNFRGERAQKGRFREFYQCDIDIIGRNQLSLAYDAEVVSTLLATFQTFELGTPVLARISNRKILSGLLESLDLKDQTPEISNIIDHAEKVTKEQTKVSLEELKLEKSQVKTILNFINLNGPRSEVIAALENLEITNSTFEQGVTELDQVLGLLEAIGLQDQIIADLKIIRGLDYYTGTVFEFILPEYTHIGSVCGGGRYDNLTGYFSAQSFPGVGGSIGLTRLFYVLNEHKLLKKSQSNLLEFCLIPVSDSEIEYAFGLAHKLRTRGHGTTIALSGKTLRDKLTYATKVAENGIIIGDRETETGDLKIKHFATGKSSDFTLVSPPNTYYQNQEPTETPDINPQPKPKHESPKTDPSDFWSDPEDSSIFTE